MKLIIPFFADQPLNGEWTTQPSLFSRNESDTVLMVRHLGAGILVPPGHKDLIVWEAMAEDLTRLTELGYVYQLHPDFVKIHEAMGEINSDSLLGKWKAISFNGVPAEKTPIPSLELEITEKELKGTAIFVSNAGNMTVVLNGIWTLTNGVMNIVNGDHSRQVRISTTTEGDFLFQPDPLLNPDHYPQCIYGKVM